MKTYKGLQNVPNEVTSIVRDENLDKKIKIIGIKDPKEFFKKYNFVAKRTLRGYVREYLRIVVFGLLIYILGVLSYAAFDLGHYGLFILHFLLSVYLLFSSSVFCMQKDYINQFAEYYIDIERKAS